MGAAHDDGNNPRINFLGHIIATDVERGVPAVGKEVFDTRDMTVYRCVDVDPDSTEAGGGTWSAQGGASFVQLSATTAFYFTQGSVTYECVSDVNYRTDGVEAWGIIYLSVDSVDDPATEYPSGVEADPIYLRGWPIPCSSTTDGYGMHIGQVSGPYVRGWVTIWNPGSGTLGDLEGVGGTWTPAMVLSPGDTFNIQFRYPV